eukprot:2098506-Rhodomonas_salina.2
MDVQLSTCLATADQTGSAFSSKTGQSSWLRSTTSSPPLFFRSGTTLPSALCVVAHLFKHSNQLHQQPCVLSKRHNNNPLTSPTLPSPQRLLQSVQPEEHAGDSGVRARGGSGGGGGGVAVPGVAWAVRGRRA